MSKVRYVYEVFEHFDKLITKEEKIEWLQNNNHHAIRDVIKGSMDPNVKWLLPEGDPPYTACSEHNAPSTLLTQNRNFGKFVDNATNRKRPAVYREEALIGILESIHPKDAELVLKMVKKEWPAKKLTKPIVREAFPGLL